MAKLRLALMDKHGTLVSSSDTFSVDEYLRALNAPAGAQHLLDNTCTATQLRRFLEENNS